jgi:16S rRNA processing protein RimM
MELSELEYITIGHILGPRGTKGKLKVKAATDFPQHFAPSSTIYINHQPMTIDSTEWHKGNPIIKLSNVDSVEDGQRLVGQAIEIHRSQLHPLPQGQYYHFQLIGLEVETTRGEPLGNITEIITTESKDINDIYVVNGNRGEILIPAIEDVVKSIDLEQGRIIIEPIKGLLSLNQRAAE